MRPIYPPSRLPIPNGNKAKMQNGQNDPKGHHMAASGSHLELNPTAKLTFTGPFTHRRTATLTLKNKSPGDRIAFKIRTTAREGAMTVKLPKGIVEPQQVSKKWNQNTESLY